MILPQTLLFPVGILYQFQVLLVDPVSGWTMFIVAMTSNQGLRADLIKKVYDRANDRDIPGVLPVYYDSRLGLPVRGVAR